MNCPVCNKNFESYKELSKHLVEEHKYTINDLYTFFNYSFKDRIATCPICGSTFKITPSQAWKHKVNPNKYIGCCKQCSIQIRFLYVKSPFANKEVRNKAKRTIKEKYGVEHALQSDKVKEKVKKTNLEKYGVECAMQNSEVKEKAFKTNLEKYGVEHPAQCKEIQEKAFKTNLERYGVEHPAQSKEIIEKMQKTTMDRFGVINASSSAEVKEKRRRTMIEKYGVDHVSKVPKFMEKAQETMKKTNLERYGVEHISQIPEVKEKMKQTNLEKYGNPYTVTTPEFMKKGKQTNIEKYGVDNVFKSEEFKKRVQETNISKYGVPYASQSVEVQEKIKETNLEKYGVEYFCQHEKCIEAAGNRISRVNKKFQEFLNENKIESELEFIQDNYGYDLKVRKTLIEIDPSYTHNATVGPFFGSKRRDPKDPNYHLDKTTFAVEHGYNCIHIFDWDEWNKILYILQSKKKIHAHRCKIKEIDKKEADEFLETYHLQGSTKMCQYAYGLYYRDKLVEVMTFGKPRYNKNYEYELLRLCTKSGISIIEGASTLLRYFEEQVQPKSIISYCDLSKFNGKVYKNLGFILKQQTSPTKHWYNPKTKVHITDNLLRQRGFDQLHKTTFGKGTSNEELMREYGYVEIFDCGQLVFIKEF